MDESEGKDIEEDDVKLEFEEEIVTFNEDRDFPAQALMTLHQSVQNLPMKHKSGLQVIFFPFIGHLFFEHRNQDLIRVIKVC